MIIFMGVAGSGKSAQGKKLADKLALPWLSTGEFLRMLVTGKRRQDMLSGKLLSDGEIIRLVRRIFSLVDHNEQEFVLDGFPRTTAQADWLLNQAKHGQQQITAVIHLIASEEEVSKRLTSRGRLDDNPEAIKARFEEYHNAAMPILEHFKEAGVKIFEIDGEASVETIHQSIMKALKPLLADENTA